MNSNPFEVLKLDPSATEEEIVRKAGLLRQTASDEETLTAVRQAVQALTGRPEDRTLLGLLTHQGAVHQWPALDRLESAFRKPPESTQAAPAEQLAIDLKEVAALLRPILVETLADEPVPLEMPPVVETPEEIQTQTVEGVWQVLPFEIGA
jgi:hypothetical protein